MTTAPYMYQLYNADYNFLSQQSTKIWVIDRGESALSTAQLAELSSQGKTFISYLEFGQARTRRDYSDAWNGNPPDYVIGDGQNGFSSAISVKYWDDGWKAQVYSNLERIIREGYEGVMFDVTDAFLFQDVQAAYEADRAQGLVNKDVYAEMEDFIVEASSFAKSINPDFKIVPNNPLLLFNAGREQIINPVLDSFAPNTRLLNAIDGVVKESLVSNGDALNPVWEAFDTKYLTQALNAGKFVLGIEYPSDPAAQQTVVNELLSLSPDYLPLITNRFLDGFNPDINAQTAQRVSSVTQLKVSGDTNTDLSMFGTERDDVRIGQQGNDAVSLRLGNDAGFGQSGNDYMIAGAGNDVLAGGSGNDTLIGGAGGVSPDDGADTIYGGSGADVILGNGSEDILFGGAGAFAPNDAADIIYGGAGNDIILGNGGDDHLYGNAGNDVFYGGQGADSFYFSAGDGMDVIFGFEGARFTGGDLILLNAATTGYVSAEAVARFTGYASGNAYIELGGGSILTIANIEAGSISADDIALF